MNETNGDGVLVSAPAVSVVIPMHNAEETILEQLRALCQQDYAGTWEVVVVDNLSTDASYDVVKRAQSWLTALNLVVAPEFASPGYARNTGVKHARSEILLFCDADDVVMPSWMSRMVDTLQNADIVGSRFDVEALSAGVAVDELHAYMPTVADRTDESQMGWAGGGGCGVWRRTLEDAGGWNERLSTGEDVELSWRVHANGGTLRFAEEAVVLWRARTSLVAGMRRQFRAGMDTPRLLKELELAGHNTERFRRSTRVVARHWASLAFRAPYTIISSAYRLNWLLNVSGQMGRLLGSLRHLRWCL